MKMFGNLSTDGLEEATDVIGGGGLLDTGIYTGIVTLAYAKKSRTSDAQAIAVHIKIGNIEFREDHWVVNKKGENSYQDKKDASKKHPLPGFTNVDDLCLVTTGFSFPDQDVEEKTVNLYDFDQKKEVPTNVPVLVDLIGKEVSVAVIRQTVDKQKKNDAGVYSNTGETRDENIADKFFHAETRRTVAEIKHQIEDPIFYDKWDEKNSGTPPRNKAKGAEGNSGAPGAPGGSSAAAAKPKTSLFAGS